MRTLISVLLVCVSGVAQAAFRDAPSASLHLIEAGDSPRVERALVRLAQADPEATSAPRLAPAPKFTPESAPLPSTDAVVEVYVDPWAGTFSGKEVLAGAGAVLAFDMACVLIDAGIFIGLSMNNHSIEGVGVGAGLYSMLVDALLEIVVSPIVAALAVYMASPKHGLVVFHKALRGAYTLQLVTIAVGAAGALGSSALAQATATATPNPLGLVVGMISFAIVLGLHYVGVPMAASYVVHWDDSDRRARGAEPSRRAVSLPISPGEFYAQASPSRASPVLAFAF